MITAAQCRAARGLLRWSQQDLADRSDVGVSTIKKFETEITSPHKPTLKALKVAFEDAGIDFIARDGENVGVQFGK